MKHQQSTKLIMEGHKREHDRVKRERAEAAKEKKALEEELAKLREVGLAEVTTTRTLLKHLLSPNDQGQTAESEGVLLSLAPSNFKVYLFFVRPGFKCACASPDSLVVAITKQYFTNTSLSFKPHYV
eukprot:3418847-Pyramimonas_sp.AAC.1